ncbi:putative RNA-binding protein containing KH domain [Candidatus Kinetoplastibacterium desouzaii TCC079E]|uniref:Putative RNA-binding protein containing KH domain n=1 Tax=Candidatus Kinetoplastidibacterium desouzai TCC079E TaxID=1208919 RepID=M1M357_9PROT|nr:YhbY family RNA-binding protein [Candidatus Kinetoplastibacterium desouzaii]AGF46700.1 putative RNA-binding protein containing KH domain [Candidatus Kinetoplastibacterium desouzaii TCC079E]
MHTNPDYTKLNICKSIAHKLEPVVMIGNKGFTEQVLKEIITALKAHKLIKIKINTKEKQERQDIIKNICEKTNCQLIQQIGKIVVIYKHNSEI